MSHASLIIKIMTTVIIRSNFGRTSLSTAGYKTMQQLQMIGKRFYRKWVYYNANM